MDPMSWCRVSLIGTPYSRANGFARGASERRGVNAALENGPTDYKGSGHVTRSGQQSWNEKTMGWY